MTATNTSKKKSADPTITENYFVQVKTLHDETMLS